MYVSQRGARAPPAASSSTSAAGMAGIGASRSGRSGGGLSYRSYAPVDNRSLYDHNVTAQWSSFDSSQPTDATHAYAGFPSAHSTSSFETHSRPFDATSVASSSSLHTIPSIQHLGGPSPEAAPSSTQHAISEADLLASVNSKRPRVLTNEPETQQGSKDGSDNSANPLDTLDLCHKRIDRVPDALIDRIKHDVVRLALGYNLITRLPDNFVELRSLRYLNIRANNFYHFPDCVTKMHNLEILDLSRNKIRKLPQEPGRLLALRVLSMNSNRLTELPTWVGKMKHLRVLKLDNNPLEWPPPHISKMPNVTPPKAPAASGGSSSADREKAKRFEDRQMLVWIAKLRSWISDPANHPQIEAVSIPHYVSSSTGAERAAATEHASISDLASPIRTDRFELPTASSDGLMSLQVEVPETVSNGPPTARAEHTALDSHAPTESVPSVTAETAPVDESAATAGLLPPLIPQPSASTERLDAEANATTSVPAPCQSSSWMDVSRQSHSTNAACDSQPLQTFVQPKGAVGTQLSDDAEARHHARNNSHSVAQDIVATHQMEGRRSLKSKKSLPDLRKSHEDILQERRDDLAEQIAQSMTREESVRSSEESIRDRTRMAPSAAGPADPTTSHASGTSSQPPRKPLLQTRRAPRPNLGNIAGPSSRQGHEGKANGITAQSGAGPTQDGSGGGGGLRKLSLPTVGATQAAADAAAAALAARAGYSHTPPKVENGHGRMASDRGDNNWPARSASPTVANSRPAADHERNSYFRRLSTLPPSTISKAVPAPVLKFVDGTRGVLFALSQIHAAIGQFMTPVIDERISSQFHRLLDISNGSVANLINALDRFDSLSRRGTPDPGVIRSVLVTCKDSVITFRKLVSVLQLQLRALQSSSDVRYARTLLLMLYGSMAEVCNSWTEMAPLVEAVQPFLTQADSDASSPATSDAATASEKTTQPFTRTGTLLQKSISATGSGSGPMLPSIAEASTPVRAGARPYLARGASRRRHAGSFSAQDLAQGAAMTPSASSQPPFNLEDLQAASVYGTPARVARTRREGSLGNSASSAATFARSESSERSALMEGTQSTAPSTPGGTAVPHRNIYATPGAISTPTSARQKRSGSNASSAVEVPPLAATTPRSQTGTPATPAPVGGRRHAASLSNGTAATTAAGNRLHMAVADPPKINIDDHLLGMIDTITKLSAQVWSVLFEHLRSAGIDEKIFTTSAEVSPVDESEDHVPTSGDEATQSLEAGDDVGGEEALDSNDAAESNKESDTVSKQKLRELREAALATDNLTSQLRSTYLRAREEERRRPSVDGGSSSDSPIEAIEASPDNISQSTVTKLFDESHVFIRAIVETSTQMKEISQSHEFPRELRRMLGQVAQACSNLTVYLLWLSPASVP